MSLKQENLFSKMNKIELEIDLDSRLNKNDVSQLKNMEENYIEFIKFANKYIKFVDKEIPNKENIFMEFETYGVGILSKNMKEKIEEIKTKFIKKVISYFETKYKADLNLDFSYFEKIEAKNLTFEVITKRILKLLKGKTFEELAKKQIKDKLFKTLNSENSKIKINSDKIKIWDFVRYDHYSTQTSLSCSAISNLTKLFESLSLFEFNNSNLVYRYSNLIHMLDRSRFSNKGLENVVDKHFIRTNAINYIKIYKNGRLDIKFNKIEYAQDFAKNFLNINF